MILTRLITHRSPNTLLVLTVLTCVFSAALIARGAEPAAQWGQAADGLQTRLTLVEISVPAGRAVRGILDVRNVSEAPIDVTFCGAMGGLAEIVSVKPNGDLGTPLKPGRQVVPSRSSLTLQPHMQINAWNIRIDTDFDLTSPGTYRIAWPEIPPRYGAKGRLPPPSNTATLRIPAAKPQARAKADGDPASKLLTALPTGWSLQRASRVGRTGLHPGLQWSRVPTGYMKLRSALIHTKEGLQRAAPPIIVWLAHLRAEKAKWQASENQQDIEQKPTEYLGLGAGYHVYIHLPPGAAKLWPTAGRDIGKALGIKTSTTQPAETTEKRAVILITQIGDTVSYTAGGVDCGDIKAVGKALAKVSPDSRLVIQIETNVPSRRVAEVLAVARKLHLMKISITVVRTSRPPVKPEWKPPL